MIYELKEIMNVALQHDEMFTFVNVLQFSSRFRMMCEKLISHKMFDYVVLVFIFLNCITIALERPTIQASVSGISNVICCLVAYWIYNERMSFCFSFQERVFLSISNYVFTVIFVAEMTVKV